MKIRATVAMPVWNAREIAWLAMESLCRQEIPRDAHGFIVGWELLICEETQENQCGREFFASYMPRLEKAGCQRLEYFSPDEWIPLPAKWRLMGQEADPDSKVFILQAADCFSFPERIDRSFLQVADNGHDWYDIATGYFWSAQSDKLIFYDLCDTTKTNLSMAFKTAHARTIPESDLKSGIDGFLFRNCMTNGGRFSRYIDQEFYHGLDTNGFNNISCRREGNFKDPKPPFFAIDKNLDAIGLPKDIVSGLISCRSAAISRPSQMPVLVVRDDDTVEVTMAADILRERIKLLKRRSQERTSAAIALALLEARGGVR